MTDEHLIPAKANRVLNLILLALLLIMARVWYLSVLTHEDYLEIAHKPQRKYLLEPVERATIRDRFNIPLAVNQMLYNAAIYYSDIRQIPSKVWKKDASGKKVKVSERSNYITELSKLLAAELNLEDGRIEDLIHSKAALFPTVPFILKEGISENQYFRLKMLEKDWPGIYVQRGYKRVYPQGKTASDIIGYLGPISDREHLAIAKEIKDLKTYLEEREAGETPLLPKGFNSPLDVRKRLKALQEKAYTINTVVGKAGIEAQFEEQLRGFYTKKFYEVDQQGRVLRELPGSRKAVSGQRVVLSISAELQEFAESLLAANESKNDTLVPWIKGGAIVAMLPTTGEVVAMASYPRFNPNDFIPAYEPEVRQKKQSALLNWIENEAFIAEIWDGKRPLEKECFNRDKKIFFTKQLPITWDNFLSLILPSDSPVKTALQRIGTVRGAHAFLKKIEENRANLSHPLLNDIAAERDKFLVIDLCRLVIKNEAMTPSFLNEYGDMPLATLHASCQTMAIAQGEIKPLVQKIFHERDFKKWREEHFKEFLRVKRKEEKIKNRYPRPYIEYLDLIEKKLFNEFWDKNRLLFLTAYFSEIKSEDPYSAKIQQIEKKKTLEVAVSQDFLKALQTYQDLKFPLYGQYRMLRSSGKQQTGKDLAAAFYPTSGYGYGRSFGYRQSTPQGSPFKLVVAYEALREKYNEVSGMLQLNPLTLIDDLRYGDKNPILGFHTNGEAIHRNYKGARMPKSSHANIGRVDIQGAIEQSSNIYFSVLASEVIEDPALLSECTSLFGYGKKTGIELPGEIAGYLPNDLGHNRTGLYSYAIGQHTLVVTPLQTAVMISAIANGGEVLKPKIIQVIAGKEPSEQIDQLFSAEKYPFQDELSLIGIHFPLFPETLSNCQQSHVACSQKEVVHTLFMPQEIRKVILEGMRRVVTGPRGTARPAEIRKFFTDTKSYNDYLDIHHQIVGKTGTAEVFYKPKMDAQTVAKIENHVWFSGISFKGNVETFEEEPELVVVVYLRFGGGGKEATPLASQMVKKWREIVNSRL